MADITKIQLPNNDVYDIKDNVSGYVAFASDTNPLLTATSVRTSYAGASGETPRYIPGKWRIQTNRNPQNGDVYIFQTPEESSAAGIYLSVNGTSDSDYHPIILNTTAMMTTHYAASTSLMVIYEPNSTGSIYALEPTTNDKVTITGIFRVLNFYDANTNTLLRTYASSSSNELPLVGSATSTSMGIPTYTSSYKDNYGGIPATVANRPVVKLSTGEVKIPAGLYLGTASSKLGKITLYNTSNSYTTIIQSDTATANRTLTLPNKTGTLAITSEIPAAYDSNPAMNGTASAGSSTSWAKGDHVHPSDTSKVDTSTVGAANGIAPLNGSGKISETYLPSYVDDVIEGYYYNNKFYKESTHTTEITGETGKIYVDLSTEKTYRYSGSAYVEISSGTSVSITRDLTSGTKSATITVDGVDYDIYSIASPTVPEAATAAPLMDGTAAVGTSTKYAKEDHVHPSDTTKANVAQFVNIDVIADASWNLTLTPNSITELNSGYTHVVNNDIFCFRLLDGNFVAWSTRLEWDGTGNINALNFKTPFVEYPYSLGYGWIRVFYDDNDNEWMARINPFPIYNGGVS